MSIEEVKEALRMKLRGWCNYFKYARCRAWFKWELDQWYRRRIHQLLWKTWKRVRTRIRLLQRLGCSKEQAYQWACTRKSYWRIANSHVLLTTLNNDFLKAHNWSWPGLLHDSIKYPPIDNRNDPPRLSKEVLSHAKKKEDHGLRCVQQWRIKNHGMF